MVVYAEWKYPLQALYSGSSPELHALESTLVRNGGQVTCPMQNAHDGNDFIVRAVVDGVSAVEDHAQSGSKLWALWMCQGKRQEPFTRCV